MTGFLNMIAGSGPDDPRSRAADQMIYGLLSGNLARGFLGAGNVFAEEPDRKLKRELGLLEMANLRSEMDARQAKAQREQAALDRDARIRAGIPGLFRQPGMTGGDAAPQTVGGVPMFSKPMGVTPMRSTPGGFDVQGALALGMDPKTIGEYAGLANIGRPKATRQMEVDDGQGGKRIALVDDFGQEVANFAGYTAPVQVNRGSSVDFVRPAPGVSLSVGMSPAERDASARGWASNRLAADRLSFDKQNTTAGKAPQGYRFKEDGSLEAIPGGPADIKAGKLGAEAAARSQSAIAQADSVLKEITDAKGMVGWNTAGVGGALSVLPSTDARDLSAKLTTIKANLGFDRLQQMRDQSPTGGALGQVAVQELASLQATVASLDQLQSPAQLGTALDKIEKHYTNWRNVVKQAANPQGGATGSWGIQKVN